MTVLIIKNFILTNTTYEVFHSTIYNSEQATIIQDYYYYSIISIRVCHILFCVCCIKWLQQLFDNGETSRAVKFNKEICQSLLYDLGRGIYIREVFDKRSMVYFSENVLHRLFALTTPTMLFISPSKCEWGQSELRTHPKRSFNFGQSNSVLRRATGNASLCLRVVFRTVLDQFLCHIAG